METSVNNKCKAFTSLEQSRKLAEILPLESADMWYGNEDSYKIAISKWEEDEHDEDDVPCWSLAALLDVLPEHNIQKTDWGNDNKVEYKIVVYIHGNVYGSNNYDNPIDACVEMVLKLHELKRL